MIKHIKINNFKSIKEAELDCGRVNIFIGEPNSGKTNILEGIGLLSFGYVHELEDLIRFEKLSNLFYDNMIGNDVRIILNVDLKYSNYKIDTNQPFTHEIIVHHDKFFKIVSKGKIKGGTFNAEYSDIKFARSEKIITDSPIKFYEFSKFNKYRNFDGKELSFLYPPTGKNLLEILKTNSELRKFANSIFENYGFNIFLEAEKEMIYIVKIKDGILISQPFYTVADTLQRILFYTAIIETNKDSTIVLDEPDVYLFPKYTKYLAERIAKYNTNQFFLTTHNPYFLLTLAEKTPNIDLRIFLTYFEDYQTKVKQLSQQEILDLRDEDASLFFNLDKYKD